MLCHEARYKVSNSESNIIELNCHSRHCRFEKVVFNAQSIIESNIIKNIDIQRIFTP